MQKIIKLRPSSDGAEDLISICAETAFFASALTERETGFFRYQADSRFRRADEARRTEISRFIKVFHANGQIV